MRDRTGWTRGSTGQHRVGRRNYKNLTEFWRPCATCRQNFSIFVTEAIANGTADSNNFGLRNCETHRRTSGTALSSELEVLRTKDKTMEDELQGLYALNRELMLRNRELEAKVMALEAQRQMKKDPLPWG